MWQEFAQNIRALTKTYKDLVAIAQKKHAALVALNFKALDCIVQDERRLAAEIEFLETQRQKNLIRLAVPHRNITRNSKLEDLLAFAPDEQTRNSLAALHRELSAVLSTAKSLSESNRMLTEGALRAVQFQMNRMSGAKSSGSYGDTGNEGIAKARGFEFKA